MSNRHGVAPPALMAPEVIRSYIMKNTASSSLRKNRTSSSPTQLWLTPTVRERKTTMNRILTALLLLLCSTGLVAQASSELAVRPTMEITGLKVKAQVDFDGAVHRLLYQEIVPCRLVDTRAAENLEAPYSGPAFVNETRTYSVSGIGKTNPCALENRSAVDGDARALPQPLAGLSVLVKVYNAETSPVAGAFGVATASATPTWFGWYGPGVPAKQQDAIVLTKDEISVAVMGAKADVTVDLLGYFVDDPAVSGPAGPQGEKGDTGAAGVAGAIGPQGPEGPAGPQGVKGDTGAAGAAGAIGPQGPEGSAGPHGAKGDTGAAGATGPQGPQGLKGDTGATGATGPQGPQGIQGPAGPPGPAPAVSPDCTLLEQIKSCLTTSNGFAPFSDCVLSLVCPPPQVRTVKER